MFSKENAKSLRDSLELMNFQAAAVQSDLLRAYTDFYGLNFGTSQHPVSHSIGRLQSGGYTIVCQHFQIPVEVQHGTVFLLHGYFDHSGLYSHLVGHCLQSGYSVVVFDLPGHGLSSGIEASIGSFREYSAVLLECLAQAEKQHVHSPWLLVGQSTGGAIIMDALLEDRLAERFHFNACVLLAPLLRPRSWYKSYVLFQVSRLFLKSTRRIFSSNSHDVEFLKFLRHSDALQSRVLQRDWVKAMIDFQRRFARSPVSAEHVQIIQGTGDGTVDWQYNLPRIVNKFPGSRTFMITGAGHHLVNEAQPYRGRLFSLLDEILNSSL